MRDTGFLTFSEMKERMHYLAWLGTTLISFPLAGHAAVLLLCVCIGEYVDPTRLQWTVSSAILFAPLAYAWRKYGERNCRFAEFDAALDHCFQNLGGGTRIATIMAFVETIDQATGMARQLARNDAKAWLVSHAPDLTEEERAMVREHLGYLCPGPLI